MAVNDRILYMPERWSGVSAEEDRMHPETSGVDIEVTERKSGRLLQVPVSSIQVSPFQTRKTFGQVELEELSRSILTKGMLQPLLVREVRDEATGETIYQLVAGERRFRAAQLAGLTRVPVLVESLSDRESLEVAIVENAQREDLNAIEEAEAYRRLAEEFGSNQTEIARAVGKNRATISNTLRLLQLAPEVLELIRSGELSSGHGRALLMLETHELQLRYAQRALRESLSVRALERLVARREDGETDELSDEEIKEKESFQRWAARIAEYLGVRASLSKTADGRRRLQLTFDTESSWKRFVSRVKD